MKAIILAAGRGSRMGHLTDAKPKGLVKLNNIPLIQHQISALKGAGMTEIGLVCGYKAEMFQSYGTHHFLNGQWSETNMVCSLMTASAWLEQDTCIISYSDIVYSSDAVSRLFSTPSDIAITYDPHWQKLWEKRFSDPLSDAETFQLDKNSYLTAIGSRAKEISEIQGQYMGLLKITPQGWKIILEHLRQLSQNELNSLSMTGLLSQLMDKKIYAVAIVDQWYEVDSEYDLLAYAQI